MTESSAASLTSEPAPTGPETAAVQPAKSQKPRGLWGDAWRDLRRRPIFLVSMAIIFVLLVMSVFPQLFTSVDPNHMDLARARQKPSAEAWFGYDTQGRDIYARAIYGARASIIVGVMATLLTVVIGSIFGLIAGYFGGWLDNLLSRFGEIFLGLPFVLGAIVILTTLNPATEIPDAFKITSLVILSISILSWPISMRIMRSAAISARNQDYVKAARALGAGPVRIILRHMLPNCLAPVLVYATIALGSFIAVEATLSFLGLGLRSPVVSWGVMIADSRQYITVAPHLLIFPAAFLVVTVLAFVMLGDAVRDALDPKQK
ncbi:oligopeptide transport system permease protein [Saccharopolyspora antimicrobica]|uniref:Oligopeptide transport system permease protein n=1 Tax=Saccharopolyspora antimicrobica TaxID=455193 RepID=A0A1I4ZIX5_9PSEU|nr:ABC transporter permease [Saccharopolyspora antimicrobica]RKT83508.1 oligopeptide transport system permease protein [Saccharopolyspora antimicrobica]SFN50211.1 oligopeptide transport system permease protein [Saccharopolyspora antimicrobica]